MPFSSSNVDPMKCRLKGPSPQPFPKQELKKRPF